MMNYLNHMRIFGDRANIVAAKFCGEIAAVGDHPFFPPHQIPYLDPGMPLGQRKERNRADPGGGTEACGPRIGHMHADPNGEYSRQTQKQRKPGQRHRSQRRFLGGHPGDDGRAGAL